MNEDQRESMPASEPQPQEAQRSWKALIEAAVAGGAAGGAAGSLAHDVYTDIKVAGKAVVNKIREHGPGPDAKPAEEGQGK